MCFVCFLLSTICLFGLAWLGLAWLGLAWFGLVWFGLVWQFEDCFVVGRFHK